MQNFSYIYPLFVLCGLFSKFKHYYLRFSFRIHDAPYALHAVIYQWRYIIELVRNTECTLIHTDSSCKQRRRDPVLTKTTDRYSLRQNATRLALTDTTKYKTSKASKSAQGLLKH